MCRLQFSGSLHTLLDALCCGLGLGGGGVKRGPRLCRWTAAGRWITYAETPALVINNKNFIYKTFSQHNPLCVLEKYTQKAQIVSKDKKKKAIFAKISPVFCFI